MIFSLLLADTPQFYPISTATTRRTPYARNAMFRSANESGDNSGVSTNDTRLSPVLRRYLFLRVTMLLKIYANIHRLTQSRALPYYLCFQLSTSPCSMNRRNIASILPNQGVIIGKLKPMRRLRPKTAICVANIILFKIKERFPCVVLPS